MAIKVVNIRFWNPASHPEFQYIGRACWGRSESIFHNPFRIGRDGTREEVIAKFAAYWYAPEQYWLRLRAGQEILLDDVLGCWCHPLSCHGDIIAGYLTWKMRNWLGGDYD